MAEAVYFAIEYVATAIGTEMTFTAAELYFASEVIVAAAALGAAKQQQVAAERKARQAWARSQSDRYLMSRGTMEPRRVVLGQRRVSGPMVYVGSYGTDREHLVFVVALAGHEVAEIGDIYFDDEPVLLDGAGNVVGINRKETFGITAASDTFTLQGAAKAGSVTAKARYGSVLVSLSVSVSGKNVSVSGAHAGEPGVCEISYQPDPCPYKPDDVFGAYQASVGTGASQVITLAHVPVAGSLHIVEEQGDSGQTEVVPTSVVGNVVTLTATSGYWLHINYQWTTGTSLARVRKYRGRMDDAADAAMVAALGGQWTSAHRGAGVAKVVVELDYDREAFSGGVPNVSAVVKGLKCYDHRKNEVPNPLAEGAVPGAPGVLPAGWVCSAGSGLDCDVVASGTDEGTGWPYLSVRLHGTTTAAGGVSLTPVPNAGAPTAAPGQAWAVRAMVRRVSGSAWSVWNAPRLQLISYSSAGSGTQEAYTVLSAAMVEGKQDAVEVSDAALGASAVRVGLALNLPFASGVVIDQTVMLLLPQLWQGSLGDSADPGAWSENPAILADNFATHPLGGRLPWSQIDGAWNGAQANICDTVTVYTLGGKDHTRALYTAGYVAAADQRPVDVLSDLCGAMGGEWVYQDGRLRTKAGAWRSPVLTLDESWLLGDVAVQSQMDLPRDDKVNCIRGGFYDASQNWQNVPFQPLEPAAYIGLDRGKLPLEVDYGAITFEGQAGYVSACRLRADRQGELLEVKCNYRAWAAEAFDVINVNLARFGLVNKAYEVRQESWTLDGGILLTLRETDASVFDMDAEFTTADPAPNTRLPDPWAIAPIAGLAAASGTAHLLIQADGTVVPRVSVTWTAVTDPRVIETTGHIEVDWQVAGAGVWQTIQVPGRSTQTYITPAPTGQYVLIKARAVGAVGRSVDCPQIMHQLGGKSDSPADVASLSGTVIYGAVEVQWALNTEPDYLETELRRGGTNWDTASPLTGTTPTRVRGAKYLWAWPAQATYTLRARHRDTSGNLSAATTTATVVVNDNIKIGVGGIDADLTTLRLDTNSQVFTFDGAGVAAPASQTITFTAVLGNLTGTAAYTCTRYDAAGGSLGTVTLGGSGNARTLTLAQFGSAASATVVATLSGLSDTVSVVRIQDGSDAVVSDLTNDSHTLPADASGNVTSYAGADTRMVIYLGIVDNSASWTFARTDSSGVTSALGSGADKNKLTVSAMTAATEAGYVDITATRSGYPSQTKRFTLAKARSATGTVGFIQNHNGFASALTFGGTATAYCRLATNGEIETKANAGSYVASSAYYLPATAGAGTGRWVKATKTSQIGAGTVSGTLGAWTEVTAAQVYSVARTTTGSVEVEISLQWSDDGGTTLIGTGHLSLYAESA